MPDLFDVKAADWDADDMVLQLSTAIGSEIIKQVELNKSMSVMDFGAGTGLICSHVAPLVNKITAVDISEAMLNKLKEKPNLDNVTALCQDIVNQPLEESFDLIVSAMAMHHVENTDGLLQRFSENLKTGAKVALADLDKEDGSFHPENTEGVYHDGFERKELERKLHDNGFVDIEFFTALVVNKENKKYPIFLAVATKS